MAYDAYETLDDCESGARNIPHYKQKHSLQVFSPSRSLNFVATDLSGSLPRTKNRNQHVIVVTDRYAKLARDKLAAKMTDTHIANVFDHWVISYGIATYLWTDNDPQFISKFVATICTYPGVIHLTTTDYRSQTNGNVERCKKTIVARLRL